MPAENSSEELEDAFARLRRHGKSSGQAGGIAALRATDLRLGSLSDDDFRRYSRRWRSGKASARAIRKINSTTLLSRLKLTGWITIIQCRPQGPNPCREIQFSIEMDVWHAPIAYWILTQHPGDACISPYSKLAEISRAGPDADMKVIAFFNLRLRKGPGNMSVCPTLSQLP